MRASTSERHYFWPLEFPWEEHDNQWIEDYETWVIQTSDDSCLIRIPPSLGLFLQWSLDNSLLLGNSGPG